MSATFYDAVTSIIGVPNNFGADVIIYSIVAIIFLRIFEFVIETIFVLIKKV